MLRFLKDFLVYGIVGFVGKIVALLLMPVYTNVLSKEEYGAMTLIFTFSGIIDLLSNLNIHSGIARDFYEEGVDRDRLVSTGFFSIMGVSLIVVCCLLITHKFWVTGVLKLNICFDNAFTLMLLSVPASSLQSYFAILTRFKKKSTLYMKGALAGVFLRVGISVFSVVVCHSGISGIFLGEFVAQLFCAVFFFVANNNNIHFIFDEGYFKRAILFAFPTLPAIFAGWLDSFAGQALIGRCISMSNLGVYSIAVSITSVFTFISTAFQNVWYPFLYENYRDTSFHNQMRNLFSFMVVVLTVISFALSVFSKEIVLLLSNSSYSQAALYIPILCISLVIYLLFPMGGSGVSVSRKTKYIGIAYIAGSTVNIASLVLLINRLGVMAVPLSLIMSRLFSYFYLYIKSVRKGDFQLPNSMLVIFFVLMAVAFILVRADLSFLFRSIFFCVFMLLSFIISDRLFDFRYTIKTFIKANSK